MMYGMNDRGKVWLVKANSKECKIVSQFNLPRKNRAPTLAHPVVFNGRFYLRNGNDLHVYDVRGPESK